MKKILLSGSLALLIVPALAFAASPSDVTLDSNVALSVGGFAVNVTASGAVLNSISVSDSGTFSVILGPGSSFSAVAPNGNQLSFDNGSLLSYECDDTGSHVSMTTTSSTATTTVTVTPSSTLCATAAPTSGGGSGGSNGPIASGGGGGGYVAPTQPGTNPIIQTSAPGTSTTLAALQAQIQALLAQIAALGGGTSFTRDLTVGSTGSDVKALQAWLNAKGYTVASSGAGSSGNETTKFGGLTRAALAKFQKAVGLTPPAGYFGAKTRAYIAAHP